MTLIYPLLALLGAFLTFYLAKHNRFDGIRASAALSIIAYLIFAQLSLNAELYSIVFFGGTFIGMSAPHRFGVYTLASSAIIFSLFFAYLVPILDGFGGALGISAFLSVCICHVFILLGAPRSKKTNI
ncbi:hypothetical protein CWB77_09725 [Pseudoalteromonas sp. S1610]|uniref:hypothetical protein n=1 Tax=unclassified Pseudoalteromonas TaxID=194690 RepID=UPI00110AAAA7|nr:MULTISPECIES: hypothetical protein [unclassified Pseudoalteromonas]TMP61214.1 hypothetical protein CWB77_09725 [Pseudoalteromonas sp. S1610]TMP74833.1 hypothetical protein CWB75_08310 [Pseudoalteromonas sp. S1608]